MQEARQQALDEARAAHEERLHDLQAKLRAADSALSKAGDDARTQLLETMRDSESKRDELLHRLREEMNTQRDRFVKQLEHDKAMHAADQEKSQAAASARILQAEEAASARVREAEEKAAEAVREHKAAGARALHERDELHRAALERHHSTVAAAVTHVREAVTASSPRHSDVNRVQARVVRLEAVLEAAAEEKEQAAAAAQAA